MKIGEIGEANPNWKGGLVKRICLQCNKEFKCKPNEIKKGRGKFCSRQCYNEWRHLNIKGRKHPLWKSVQMHCQVCNKFSMQNHLL